MVGRCRVLVVLVLSAGAASCTGMLHQIGGDGDVLDVETTATFNMFTNSDYDLPNADWEAVTIDDNFLYYECLVERTSQVTDEVTETGIWETCESPYDLREAPGIDVEEGFNGQLTVRAVSRSGNAGESISKPFRRAFWHSGFSDTVKSVAIAGESIIVGGESYRTGFSYSSVGIGRLNSDGSVDLTPRSFIRGFGGGIVNDLIVGPDGKILVAGDFEYFDGKPVPKRLIRLNTNGTVDETFSGISTGFNIWIHDIEVQDDGKILVGGQFTAYNGNFGVPDYFIRLNSDGSVDSTFTGMTSGFNGLVASVAVQPDGKILVGGQFTSYNGSAAAPDRLIRLNSNGSVDSSFSGVTTGFDAGVTAIVLQDDGKILVGGGFSSFNSSAGAPDRLVRLNVDGSLDTSFSGITSGFNGAVNAIKIQDDGKILVGGDFTSYNGNAAAPDRLIRLNPDGSIDGTFSGLTSGFDGQVHDILIVEGDDVLVAGWFGSTNGDSNAPDYLVRLNPNGMIDDSFTDTNINGWLNCIVGLPDGKLLFGGLLSSVGAGFNGFTGRGFAPLNSNGSLNRDRALGVTSGLDSTVNSLVIQDDGKMILGGDFSSFNGNVASPDYLIRLNADGSLDNSFSGNVSGFNGTVFAVSLQKDKKILVGGSFTSYNGNSAAPDRLIRLNEDGSVDSSFSGIASGFNGDVLCIVVQSDGKILVAGDFTSYNGNSAAPDRLIRLNEDGSVDPSFPGITSGFDGAVFAAAIQGDGKILIGGVFTSYNGSSAAPDSLIRLNSDGSLDSSFSGVTTGFDTGVYSVTVHENGKILVGGAFTSMNGNATASDYLIRLTPDGSIDADFAGLGDGLDGYVWTIRTQTDGKILLGGEFFSHNNDPTAPDRLTRLNTDGSIDKTFGQRR